MSHSKPKAQLRITQEHGPISAVPAIHQETTVGGSQHSVDGIEDSMVAVMLLFIVNRPVGVVDADIASVARCLVFGEDVELLIKLA
jgi:hypothetical protein